MLHLRDLGYFKLCRMKTQSENKEYWLSRLQPRTKVFDRNGQAIDLQQYLKEQSQHCNQFEIDVTIGAEAHVQARLICCKLSEESANRRRAKLNKNSNKQGRKPSAEILALCDWNLFGRVALGNFPQRLSQNWT